jgi:hypothetical protein
VGLVWTLAGRKVPLPVIRPPKEDRDLADRGHWLQCEVSPMMAIFGAILPRFTLLVAWSNDSAYWESLFGSQLWLLGGFLVLPWTTLIYGFVQPNGLSLLDWIFLGCAFMLDLATWGVGALASRKQASTYRSA